MVSCAIRSPSEVSPSSSTGVSRLTCSRPQAIRSRTRSTSMPSSAAISCGLRVAAELALERAAGAADLVELLDHVHRQPDDAGLLGDAAGDRLAYPPGRVGRELVALGVVELLDRADQAGVALLDQVEHRHLGAAVLAGDRDDQPQVGGDERVDGLAALLGEPLELLLGGAHRARRPSCGPRGPRPAGARPAGRPRWSWRARPRWRRRAGGCARSRRGTGRRCRGPRSRGVPARRSVLPWCAPSYVVGRRLSQRPTPDSTTPRSGDSRDSRELEPFSPESTCERPHGSLRTPSLRTLRDFSGTP